MINIITIILLTGVYLYSVCNIFGSIDVFHKKDADGLKGKILNYGYDK